MIPLIQYTTFKRCVWIPMLFYIAITTIFLRGMWLFLLFIILNNKFNILMIFRIALVRLVMSHTWIKMDHDFLRVILWASFWDAIYWRFRNGLHGNMLRLGVSMIFILAQYAKGQCIFKIMVCSLLLPKLQQFSQACVLIANELEARFTLIARVSYFGQLEYTKNVKV